MPDVKSTYLESLLNRANEINANLSTVSARITGISRKLADSLREPSPVAPDEKSQDPVDLLQTISRTLNYMEMNISSISTELTTLEKAV